MLNDKDNSWECPNCYEILGELNTQCEYCKIKENINVYNPNKYYIRDCRILHITEQDYYGIFESMTPQEELFSKLFNHEKILVKDMDTLSLRAHREELSKIAFEARARLSAADDEERSRKPKREDKGFSRSISGDDIASDAINAIKERQIKLTKSERMLANLVKAGIDPKEAERIMSAGAIIKQISDKKKIEEKENKTEEKEEQKTLFNPFNKKES